MSLLLAVTGASSKPATYEEALQQAQNENKPLLVLVGAKWCVACEVMKRETIEPMKASGELKDVIVAYIDKDQRPELAQQLMKGETLPQIVMFSKEKDQWRRLSLTGMQSKTRMNELLGRVANAATDQVQTVR
ncbi:MAG: thioredoxin family protein [Pirellulaceae bacterium]|nr:thioredoxin family protein [Pirellulaceae bacterium]